MTRARCDSTTDQDPLYPGEHPHSPGCIRAGSACTSSLLRLALTSGSAYAVRFTTCIVDINSPDMYKERARRKKFQGMAPYKKRCRGVSNRKTSVEVESKVISDNFVSSTTELSLIAGTTEIEAASRSQFSEEFITDILELQRQKPKSYEQRGKASLKPPSTLLEKGHILSKSNV